MHDLGNDEDELGDNLENTDLGAVGALRMDGGLDHTCTLLLDGTVKCWGKNYRGALGLGDFRTRGDFPGEVRVTYFYIRAFAMWLRSVMLRCCRAKAGRPIYMRCGCAPFVRADHVISSSKSLTELTFTSSSPPFVGSGLKNKMGANLPTVFLGDGRTAMDVSCGNDFSCAVLDNGGVKCWGAGTYAGVFSPSLRDDARWVLLWPPPSQPCTCCACTPPDLGQKSWLRFVSPSLPLWANNSQGTLTMVAPLPCPTFAQLSSSLFLTLLFLL